MPYSPSELQYIAETAGATWWLVYSSWALALGTLVIAGGTLWVMWRQFQKNKATTQLNLHLQLVNDFESERMCDVRSRVAAALLEGREPATNDIGSILSRLEGVAYYANRKMLDRELVWNDFSYATRCYWHQLKDYVIKQRRLWNDKTMFSETERLYVTLGNEDAKRRSLDVSIAYLTEAEIKSFLEAEADISDRLPLRGLRSPYARQ